MKELITPAMATELLENNSHNRKISIINVNKIARAMTDEKWAYNGEGIIVSREGSLLDGQHRLLGLIKANKDVWMEIVRDVPDICEYTSMNVFATIDTGKNRSASDVISIHDKSVKAAEIVKTIKAMREVDLRLLKNGRGGAGGAGKITNDATLEFYIEKEEEIQNLLEDAKALKADNQYSYIDYYDFVVLKHALRNEPRDHADKFIKMMSIFTNELIDDGELCGEENENLCRIMKLIYTKMSESYELMGGGSSFGKIKNIAFFKAYHYYTEGIETGMGITRTMDIIYPETLDTGRIIA